MTVTPDATIDDLVERRFILDLLPEDASAAFRIHARRQFSSPTTLLVLSVLFIAVAVKTLPPVELDLVHTAFYICANLMAEIALFALFCAVLMIFLPTRQGKRYYSQQLSLHETMQIYWNAEGLGTKAVTSNTFTPWANYKKLKESKTMFLLYQSDFLFQFLPKRAMTSSQIADLRTHLFQR